MIEKAKDAMKEHTCPICRAPPFESDKDKFEHVLLKAKEVSC